MLPKIIDLFSGCGGLALGFEKAGFDIVAGIELMPEACKTISYNLSWRYGKKETHICGDITEIEASVFKNSFGDEGCIVIGGPPCQAYSMAGRGKLRSLGEDRVNIKDARGYLYQDFLRFVFELEARAVVMENVPESTNFGGKNIPEIVCTELTKKGYKAYWTILNSADYGVPQVIISRMDFDAVQILMSRDTIAVAGRNESYMYAGILYCGDCGSSMVHRKESYKGREYINYICSNYNRNGKDACSRHCIREEDLNQIVLGELQGYINSMCDCEKVLEHLDELNVNYDEAVAHDKEIVALKQELTKCSAFKASLYQDLRDEIISKEQFTRYREEFSAKERELEQAIREQETIIRNIYENGIVVAKDLEQFREGLVIGNLDRVALVSFIDRILIYDDFRVEIVFKYIATYAPYGYVKSPEDKHKLVVDEFASQIVKRIFKEFLSGKSMYKIAEGLNRDGIDTPGVYIAMQVGSEKQLARYREKKPLWNNVAIGRILGNEQYTGTMIYSRFKIENVGDKHAKALPEDEWKRVENCHEAIISKEDFEKVAAMRKENTCASVKRKHETHCLTGKMICGNCGHRLSHTYAGRPKYYCANHYLDKTDEKCNISVLDADMESVVKKALQMMIDAQVDSRKVVDMQREKQAERLKQAEKHLSDMEYSRELIEKDLREAYESYKLGMTDKETYLEQRKTYEQMLERLQENIEKQRAAVTKMADVDVPEVAGLEMLEGQLKLTGLNREMVDVFVEKIVVYAQDRVEIKWKFKDEFGEVGKVEKDRIFGGEYGNGVV